MTPHTHNPSLGRLPHAYNATCEKPVIGVSSKDLTHWTNLQYSFEFYQIPVCLFVGYVFFGFSLQERRTPSQHFYGLPPTVIMSNCMWIWVFHPGGRGDLPHLATSNTRDLLLLLFYTTVTIDFGRCPISELIAHSPRMVNQPSLCTHTQLNAMLLCIWNASMPY